MILRVAEKWFCKPEKKNPSLQNHFTPTGFFFRLEKSGSVNSDFFFWLESQKKRWVYTIYKPRTTKITSCPCINPPFFRLEKSGSSNLNFFIWLETKKKSKFAESKRTNVLMKVFWECRGWRRPHGLKARFCNALWEETY